MNGSSKAKSKLGVNLATGAASRNAGKAGGTGGGGREHATHARRSAAAGGT